MRGIKYILIILLTSAIWSCKSVEYVPVESGTDSVVIERLVEVPLPPDSATIRALLECDEHGRVVLRWLDIANSRNAQAQMTIDSLGNLLAKMRTLQDTVYLPAKEVVVSKKEKVPYPVERELTRWEQFRMDVGGWSIAFIIIIIVIVIGRIIYKLRKK